MSLIDEALKRARMEAAQKAAESEGLPYPTIPRHLGPPRRRGWLVPLVIGLAVIAGLVVGALLASRGGSRSERMAAVGGGEASATAPPATGPAAAAPAVRDPAGGSAAADSPATDPVASASPATGAVQTTSPATAPAPAAMEPAAEAPAAPRPRAEPVTPGPSRPDGGRQDRTAAPPPVPGPAERRRPAPATLAVPAQEPPAAAEEPVATPPATAPPVERPAAPPSEPPPAATEAAPAGDLPAAATVTDPDSGVLLVLPDRPTAPTETPASDDAVRGPTEAFTQQVPLAGGGVIELGGIAWSETGPFALINGRVVGPGSVIDGYTLERIRPGHVVLSGDGRRVRLSLQ